MYGGLLALLVHHICGALLVFSTFASTCVSGFRLRSQIMMLVDALFFWFLPQMRLLPWIGEWHLQCELHQPAVCDWVGFRTNSNCFRLASHQIHVPG